MENNSIDPHELSPLPNDIKKMIYDKYLSYIGYSTVTNILSNELKEINQIQVKGMISIDLLFCPYCVLGDVHSIDSKYAKSTCTYSHYTCSFDVDVRDPIKSENLIGLYKIRLKNNIKLRRKYPLMLYRYHRTGNL